MQKGCEIAGRERLVKLKKQSAEIVASGDYINQRKALKIAKEVCREMGWQWKDVSINDEYTYWFICTNSSRLGGNAWINVDKRTGRVFGVVYHDR